MQPSIHFPVNLRRIWNDFLLLNQYPFSPGANARYRKPLALEKMDFCFTMGSLVSNHTHIYEKMTRWAASWQNQQMACAPSKDSDQPGHPPSLIRVFAVRMKKAWILSYPLNAQWRLWSDWADAQPDPSLHWALSHFVGFVMRWLKWLHDIAWC